MPAGWKRDQTKGRRAGNAMLELGLLLPVLMLMVFGTMDFARVFYVSIAVTNAARAGVQYGMQSASHAADLSRVEQAARNDAPGVTGLSATASRWCKCTSGLVVDCNSGTCGGGRKLVYVEVITRAPFNTLVPCPGIPSPINLSAKAVMRVQ